MDKNDEILEIGNYFQENYTGQRFASGRVQQGLFPYDIWNMFDRVRNRLPRTNNSIEGWHNSFGSTIHPHPELYKLAEKFYLEQNKQHKEMLQHKAEKPLGGLKRTRTKYLNVTNKLIRLISKHLGNHLTPMEFLRAVANVIPIPTQ